MLTFRGLELREMPLATATIHFDLRRGFFEPPQIRGDDYVIPGALGRVWAPKQIDHQIIELQGFVRGFGSTEEERSQAWHEATADLMSVMSFDDEPGEFVVEPPYLGLETAQAVEAVAINTMSGPVLRRMSFQTWSIQLMVHEPEWEASGGSGS